MPVSRAFLYISFRIPSKGSALQVPLVELPERERERYGPFPELSICLSESPVKQPPSRFPNGAPVERDACFQSLVHISWSPNKQGLLIRHNLTFLSKSVKEAPLPWSLSSALMQRDAEFPESVVYSFICISQYSPFKELSHKTEEKYMVTIHRAPRRQKACAARFPKGIVCDTGVTTTVPCSLQHDTFHFGLGRPLVLHTCYYLPRDPGYGTLHNPEVQTRVWILVRFVHQLPNLVL
jgi:hypothetical protein